MSRAEVERREGVAVVRPREDIDAANATALREQLADCVDVDTDQLIVDLSNTRYIDSAGLDMLFRLSELLRQRRAALVLVITPDSNLARLGEIVGLPNAMAVYATVADALDARVQRSLGG
jgi:anti-anti-sigma factor